MLGKQQFVSYDIEKLGNTYHLTPSSPQKADKNKVSNIYKLQSVLCWQIKD